MINNMFMASEVRSGSTYIAEIISYSLFDSFGVECWQLANENFSVLSSQEKLNPGAVLQDLHKNHLGFRSSKWMVNDLKYLFRSIEAGDASSFNMLSSETAWIVVFRKNVVRQAISLAYAKKSGIYHSYNCNDAGAVIDDIGYEEFRLAFREILSSNYYLQFLLGKLHNKAIVYYEDFLKDPEVELKRIFSEISLPIDIDKLKLSHSKLVPTHQLEKEAYESVFLEKFLAWP